MRPALPAGSGRLQAAGTARAVALAREPGRALQAAQVLQMSGRPLSAAALLHRGRGCRRRRSVSFQRQPAPLPARLTQSRLWRGSLLGGICLELRFVLARGCGSVDAAPGSPPDAHTLSPCTACGVPSTHRGNRRSQDGPQSGNTVLCSIQCKMSPNCS